MKKEIFAALILAVILVLSLCNSAYLTKLTNSITDIVDKAEHAARLEDWDNASIQAQEALDNWKKSEKYYHTVLGHRDIDTVTQNLDSFLCNVEMQNLSGVMLYATHARESLENINDVEKIKIENIF